LGTLGIPLGSSVSEIKTKREKGRRKIRGTFSAIRNSKK